MFSAKSPAGVPKTVNFGSEAAYASESVNPDGVHVIRLIVSVTLISAEVAGLTSREGGCLLGFEIVRMCS